MKRYNTMLRWLSWMLVLAVLVPMAPMGLAAGEEEPKFETVYDSYVNPIYADAEAEAPANQAFESMPAVELRAKENAGEMEDASLALREALVNRESVATVEFLIDDYRTGEDAKALIRAVYADAIRHTGVPNEGDYIQYNGCSWASSISYGPKYNGRYYYSITYELSYYSTAAQEAAVDAEVERVLNQLDLYDSSDHDKVCGIYDYICDTVTYDYDNLEDTTYKLKYTSYAAFIDKTAVCQGYALMFYRLALELGVDTRVITGTGNGGGHAWNIVELGGQYYNLDATWDAGRYFYSYFLRSTANFGDHTRYAEYETVAFHANYPTSIKDYSTSLNPANGLLAYGNCGTNCTWTMHTDNILRISGTGAMNNFTQGNAPWKDHVHRIQGIEIAGGITAIGNYAFYGCRALPKVTIPSSITSVDTAAFGGCPYLSEITFNGDAPTIAGNSFSGVTAKTMYYNNGSWTGSNMLHYGGSLTWTKLEGYTVQFQNWNGDVISTWTGGLGETVKVPASPVRPADNTYTYTFNGWDKPVVPCAGNAVYLATYKAVFIDYTVEFRNADGTLISTGTYHYGDMVAEPDEPRVPASADQSFVFRGWDKDITPCAGNTTYTAVFGPATTPGDFTGDELVTDADVIWLLWHTVFPGDYPLNGDADFTGDGLVTDADVIWLLWHTVFPEDYPLN